MHLTGVSESLCVCVCVLLPVGYSLLLKSECVLGKPETPTAKAALLIPSDPIPKSTAKRLVYVCACVCVCRQTRGCYPDQKDWTLWSSWMELSHAVSALSSHLLLLEIVLKEE